jgi:hypothetical protein
MSFNVVRPRLQFDSTTPTTLDTMWTRTLDDFTENDSVTVELDHVASRDVSLHQAVWHTMETTTSTNNFLRAIPFTRWACHKNVFFGLTEYHIARLTCCSQVSQTNSSSFFRSLMGPLPLLCAYVVLNLPEWSIYHTTWTLLCFINIVVPFFLSKLSIYFETMMQMPKESSLGRALINPIWSKENCIICFTYRRRVILSIMERVSIFLEA